MGTIAEQFAQYRALKDKVRKEKRRDGNHSGAVCSILGSQKNKVRKEMRRDGNHSGAVCSILGSQG